MQYTVSCRVSINFHILYMTYNRNAGHFVWKQTEENGAPTHWIYGFNLTTGYNGRPIIMSK